MPEGDTIAWHAARLRPALQGHAADEVRVHRRFARERWGERLAGRTVAAVNTRGKHLLIAFEGGLVLHSHLGMVGSWGVYPPGRRWGRSPRRAWLMMRVAETEVVEFDGSTLELMTEGRARIDQRIANLGPDVLAEEFDREGFLRRLRQDDPSRAFGDALLDQRNLAGIGNMWKAEACWEAELDPWRVTAAVSDEEAIRAVELVRPHMQRSAREGPRAIERRVYKTQGRPCPRCGSRILARAGGWARSPSRLAEAGPAPRHPVGDENRLTYWCAGCQL